MIINYQEIFNNTGRNLENEENVFYWLNSNVDYLLNNNKNLTKKQYEKIEEIKEILKAIK
jgi:hypothetical protein